MGEQHKSPLYRDVAGVCSECGCTEYEPCIAEDGSTCGWAAGDLCTFCLSAKRVVLYTMGDLNAELRRIDREVAAIRGEGDGRTPEADWEAERYLIGGGSV